MKNNFLLYSLLIVATMANNTLFGIWADPKFPEKLTQRYPAYKGKIIESTNIMSNAWKMMLRDPNNDYAQTVITDQSKALADIVCEAARKEINDQITEESEFTIIRAD